MQQSMRGLPASAEAKRTKRAKMPEKQRSAQTMLAVFAEPAAAVNTIRVPDSASWASRDPHVHWSFRISVRSQRLHETLTKCYVIVQTQKAFPSL